MTPPINANEDPGEMREGEEAPPAGVRTMAIVRWALVGLMALVAVGSAASYFGWSLSRVGSEASAQQYYCPMHPQIVQDHRGECPICNMTLVPRPAGPVKPSASMQPAAATQPAGPGKYWCPMHPQVTSDDPNAKCDLCGGMKLVPRPTATGTPNAPATEPIAGLVPVDLPPDRVQRSGIRMAAVTRGALVNELRTAGVVEANERGLAQISPRFSGWIEELFVNETGQQVKRGQALATIYSPEVLQAQQEMLSALGWSAGAASAAPHHGAAPLAAMVTDARHRLELLGISPQEIDAIIKSGQPRRAIAIRSPVEGHVIAKNAVIGMSVSAGTPLFQVADLSTVWVLADVYEGDMQRVRVGQPARFETTSSANQIFKGKVSFIYPTLDPASRTLRLRLEFRNRPDPRGLPLKPGMYGNVMLDLPAHSGLMIPAEALVDTGDLQYVFVAKEGGRFEPRRVKLGGRVGERFEVLVGLAEGEKVVTSANFLIDSESRLRAAIEGTGDTPAR
jgi:membrane fusion protein, copper/silver efflux system